MANGGHISCVECTYNRLKPGFCDLFGVRTSGLILCRAFRMPKQSHREARSKFKMLDDLKPGLIYEIDNDTFATGNPRPIYEIKEINRDL